MGQAQEAKPAVNMLLANEKQERRVSNVNFCDGSLSAQPAVMRFEERFQNYFKVRVVKKD